MKATAKRETENNSIEITLTRTVADKVANLDGHKIVSGREVYENYEVKITSKKTGQAVRTSGKPGGFAFFAKPGDKAPAGAVARLGDSYVGKIVYDNCMEMIAELDTQLPKTDEQTSIEATDERQKKLAENEADKIAEYERALSNSSGWCGKCKDWTYGDCGHKQ